MSMGSENRHPFIGPSEGETQKASFHLGISKQV